MKSGKNKASRLARKHKGNNVHDTNVIEKELTEAAVELSEELKRELGDDLLIVGMHNKEVSAHLLHDT
jgi:hypothetical protein